MYDIAIIGAGPAGATLARFIACKYRVLVIEKDGPKCCGGLLAPDAQKMIARLGLVIPDEILSGPQLFSVRTIDFENDLRRYYQRHYINIDRSRFDDWLRSLIPAEVDLRLPCTPTSVAAAGNGDHFEIRFKDDAGEHLEKAKILIGADGAFSTVRRTFVKDHRKRKMYTAIQEWHREGGLTSSYGAFFDKKITDFYSWSIPKNGQLIIGTAIPAGVPFSEPWGLLKSNLRAEGLKLGEPERKEVAQIVRPLSLNALCPVVKNTEGHFLPLALIGEAAGFISPSSAEGISYGFRSALALADALNSGIPGFQERYKRNLYSLYFNIAVKLLKSPAMFVPSIRKRILSSGICSLKVRES